MSLYAAILRLQGRQSVIKPAAIPRSSLGVSYAENLKPQMISLLRNAGPVPAKVKLERNKHRDQYQNIKIFTPLTADSFPRKGGGLI